MVRTDIDYESAQGKCGRREVWLMDVDSDRMSGPRASTLCGTSVMTGWHVMPREYRATPISGFRPELSQLCCLVLLSRPDTITTRQ